MDQILGEHTLKLAYCVFICSRVAQVLFVCQGRRRSLAAKTNISLQSKQTSLSFQLEKLIILIAFTFVDENRE